MLSSLVFAAALVGIAAAGPFNLNDAATPQLFPRAACDGNTASTRSQWCDYSIDTDYYETVPETGVTREYWLDLTDVTVAPDGVSRSAMAINGSIPGPTLIGDWGDTFIVHVTNSLSTSTNGTSIHFHGIRQNYTNPNDGVVSITQCPTPPASSITYTWKATQYGSTWYHSHFALQAWEGVFGGIIINGPATANYDTDLGVMFLNDWSHQTVDELYVSAETSGPPTLDTGLINGTNVYGDDDSTSQTGYRWNTTVSEGTTYRLRLVNAAVDTHWKFSIDNHTIGVIASDLVPIEPYNTTVLNIAMGQRYDIIIYTDGMTDIATDFWLRAIPQDACSENDSPENIKGIISYGTSVSTPSTTGYSYIDSCEDEDLSSLVPYVSKTVSSATWDVQEDATVGSNDEGYFLWYLNETTMAVDWADPTLLQIYSSQNSSTATTFDTGDAVVSLDGSDEWAHIVIQTTMAVPHPIHLHGFDFFILAQGTGTYSTDGVTLNLDNPPRRDTAMLPATGYLVLAFQTDNPGAWLMHCHIGWHTSEGFAMQWIVREDEISSLVSTSEYSELESNCAAWKTYANTNSVLEDDSGV